MVYDPISQGTGASYGASLYPESHFAGGGTSLSPGERRQNELMDRRAQINQYEGIDPYLLDLLNGKKGYAEQNSTEELIQRYGSVYDAQYGDNAQAQDAASYVNQIFGGQDVINNNAYRAFRSTFGRAPTASELAQIIPIFGGAEGNTRGAAAVASMFDAYKQSPEYLKTQTGQYSDELDSVFDQLLGRDFTSSELDYYGQQLAGGRSQYEIENALKQTQEYQTAEDKKFRGSLASELEGYDQSFFNKASENVISRLNRNMGGAGRSSAMDFALTDLMGQIAEKRGQYLAGITSQQYAGNKDAARADYTTSRDRYFGDQDYTRRRNDSEADYYRDRGDQDRDYQRNMEDYFNMLGRQKQGSNTLHTGDWINMGLQGANAYGNATRGGGGGGYSYFDY